MPYHIHCDQMGSGNAGNGLLSRSQNGPPPRPSNLPPLRRRTTSSSNSTKSQDLQRLHSNHVLTPFDYPLSNPIITSDGAVNHESHGYYTRYSTKIKEEKKSDHKDGGPVQKRNLNSIHSAPLYSVHALSNARGSTSQSASATPTPQQHSQHFALSTALLQIPQHQRPAVHGASC